MRSYIFILLATALLFQSASSVPCISSSLSTGGTSFIAETRAKVTVEGQDHDGGDGCSVSLRLLLVGGGGDGDAFSGNGGGSGYVEFSEVRSEEG